MPILNTDSELKNSVELNKEQPKKMRHSIDYSLISYFFKSGTTSNDKVSSTTDALEKKPVECTIKHRRGASCRGIV